MEIKYFKTGEITPYAANNRIHPKSQIEHIKGSITKFGFTNPILLDSKLNIIAGHARHQAAQELGINELPCVMLKDLTPTEVRALRIADNKLALDSEWDWPALKEELDFLELQNFPMEMIGLEFDEVEPVDVKPPSESEESQITTCPACGHEF